MNEGNKKIYIFETLIMIFSLFYIFIIASFDTNIRNIITICFLMLLLILAYFLIGYKKDNAFDREVAIKLEVSTFIGIFFIYFLLGLLIGFSKTPFSTNQEMILIGFIPTLFIIILEEIIRYILSKSNDFNKKHIKILTILFIILNVLIETNLYLLSSNYLRFIWLSIVVFPIVSQELLCSYMTSNFGLLPSLIFKIFVKLYVYVLPVFPNLSDYLYGVLNILIPYIIYLVQRKYIIKIDRLNRRKGKENKFISKFISIPMILMILIVTSLVSGLFNHQLIAIASGSMVPTYERGDAILISKNDNENVEVGDILVYVKDNSIVAHRLVRIVEYDGDYYYYTKGDANLTPDNYYIKGEDVVGKVEYVIKYIGWPTIYMNELFRKR